MLMKRNLSVIAPVEQIDMLITDKEADEGIVGELRRRGVEVVLGSNTPSFSCPTSMGPVHSGNCDEA